MEQKTFVFDHIIDIRDELARPGLAMARFDALFLKNFRSYKLQILTQFGQWLYNVHNIF